MMDKVKGTLFRQGGGKSRKMWWRLEKLDRALDLLVVVGLVTRNF
jgi:hypothetical protein